ncbi:MAG: hypothetical protein VB877_13505 [Pirellulaceae bacterium]
MSPAIFQVRLDQFVENDALQILVGIVGEKLCQVWGGTVTPGFFEAVDHGLQLGSVIGS